MAAPQPTDSTVGFMLGQPEEDRERRARVLVGGSLAMAALITVGSILRHALFPMALTLWVPLMVAAAVFAAAPWLYKRVGVVTTGVVVPATLAGVIGVVAYNQAGIGTPMAMGLAVPPLVATLFSGRRAGAGVAVLSGLVLCGLYALEHQGHAFTPMPMDSDQLALARLNILGIVVAISTGIAWLYEHERLRRESRLHEVQARYALAVEGSEDGLFDLLIDSRATLYSPAFKHLLGYAPDAPLDASLFQLASRPASLEATLRDVQHTGGNVDVEVKLRRQDGQVGWFQLRGIVVRELTQTRLVGSIRDIDARKQAESLKDEFVATVSHELRTPLTSIHGSLALLEHTAGDSLTPDARGLVDITRRNTDRLRALVDDLLDVQKLEMGGVVLTREPCDVQDLLNETLALHAGLEEKHGVRLKLAAHLPRAQVPLDRRRIQQVLTNLVSNACKFAPPGSAVTLDASLSGDELRLRVSDLGPGVPAGFDAQLFQRFAQADSSAVRMHSGTGLGLYISRRIVESHGGHIGYRRENATSVFEVTLPAHGGRGARGDEP